MELIQGLHVDVPGSEMKTLFEGRLRYHSDKAEKLQAQLVKFTEIDQALADDAHGIGKISSGGGAVGNLESSIKKHRDQTVYYSFMVDHVVVGATYRLSNGELLSLGIQAERFYG